MTDQPQAGRRYEIILEEQFESCLTTREKFYGLEPRWPESEFWRLWRTPGQEQR